MAKFHVNFEPLHKKRDGESPKEHWDSADPALVHLSGRGDEKGSDSQHKSSMAALIAYFGGSIAVSVLVFITAQFLPPIATGGLLLSILLIAGGWIFVRQPMEIGTNNGRVQNLRQELDVSRREYERLFSAVPDFICVLDQEHNILQANDSYRQEFGANGRSLCYEVCKNRTSICPDCVVDATFSDGAARTQEEVLVTRTGRHINALVHTQPIFDDDLNINAVMEVFTDVTEVKRLQRQLALTGRAVAGTAHRIKNILMGLEGGIFIVNDGLESDNREAISSGWEMVERNVGRVTAIVRDLLFCAKERAPEFSENVCPQEILLEVRDLYADRMAGENVEIVAEVPLPHHRGTFDSESIHNLLCNLAANAIDACRFDSSEQKTEHRVVLRCSKNNDGHTVFEVEDDGEGIPEELTLKVFNEFFSSKGTEGTGIGLLVVQKVAEEHGGSVSFNSNPGEGTVFSVTIPEKVQLPFSQQTANETPKLKLHSN
jgi:PAS domain S-box-containing protein